MLGELGVDTTGVLCEMDMDKRALYAVLNETVWVPRDVSDLVHHYVQAIGLCTRFAPLGRGYSEQ